MRIIDYLHDLGNLHDACVMGLNWNSAIRCFRVLVDDLHANMLGLPNYQGPIAAALSFEAVTSLQISLSSDDSQTIYELQIALEDSGVYRCKLLIAPVGLIVLTSKDVKIIAESSS